MGLSDSSFPRMAYRADTDEPIAGISRAWRRALIPRPARDELGGGGSHAVRGDRRRDGVASDASRSVH